jgi:hypothetical protein
MRQKNEPLRQWICTWLTRIEDRTVVDFESNDERELVSYLQQVDMCEGLIPKRLWCPECRQLTVVIKRLIRIIKYEHTSG